MSRHRVVEGEKPIFDEHHDRGRSERLRDRPDLEQRVGIDVDRMVEVRDSVRRGVTIAVYEKACGRSGNPITLRRRAQHLGELPVDRHDGTLRAPRGQRARLPHQNSGDADQVLAELIDRHRAPEVKALHHSETKRTQGFQLLRGLDALGDDIEIQFRCHLDD